MSLSQKATAIIESYGLKSSDYPAKLLKQMLDVATGLMKQANDQNEGPKNPKIMYTILFNMREVSSAITELKAIVDLDTKAFDNSYNTAKEIFEDLCK